jgi:ribosomal protein S18 acetylase RimI-like enzyme
MVILQASIDDLNGLSVLWLELMENHKDYNPVFRMRDDQQDAITNHLTALINSPNTKIFIAKRDVVIIGMLVSSITFINLPFELHKKGYIAETIVTASFRGQGIGHDLYSAAELWLQDQGADHIVLQVSVANEKALQFWQGSGFLPLTYAMTKQL